MGAILALVAVVVIIIAVVGVFGDNRSCCSCRCRYKGVMVGCGPPHNSDTVKKNAVCSSFATPSYQR